jgi:hypothetical protein
VHVLFCPNLQCLGGSQSFRGSAWRMLVVTSVSGHLSGGIILNGLIDPADGDR